MSTFIRIALSIALLYEVSQGRTWALVLMLSLTVINAEMVAFIIKRKQNKSEVLGTLLKKWVKEQNK